MRKITKRTAAVAAAAAIAVGGAGAAWAVWTLTGEGTSTATAGTTTNLSVSAVAVEGQLAPGYPSDVSFSVSNPNKFPVRITSATIDNITGSTACAGDNIEDLDAPLPTGDALVVDAATTSQGTKTITIDDAIRMKSTAGDDCKNAVFTFDINLDAESVAPAGS